MHLSSQPTARRVGPRDVLGLSGRRWPLSYALPALAVTAVWLFLTIWLPAGEMQQAEASAPERALTPVPTAQLRTAWPEPAVREEALALAEPSPTF